MTIAEVSKMFDMTSDTLRYYERIGLIPPVGKNKSGMRDYTEKDCKWVKFAKCMRAAGLSVEALVEYATLFQKGDSTAVARKDILLEQRELLISKMEDMQASLDRLNQKIENYETIIIPKLKELE